MSHIPELDQFQPGNIVHRSINFGQTEMCQIEEIERENEIITHCTISTGKEKNIHVRGIDLRPILLEPEHLQKIGFLHNEVNHVFILYQIAISYAGGVKGEDAMNLTYVAPSMRIFRPFQPVPQRFEEFNFPMLEERTIDIPFIHTFQNYCASQNMKLNFSVLL
jgi:hypothetical protein